MLWLQNTAGNSAVAGLLADQAAPPPPPRTEAPSVPPSSAPEPVQLSDLAGGDDSAAALLAGIESDFAAAQAGAMAHLTGAEARLDEAQATATARLDAGHQAESAVFAGRTVQAQAAVTAQHEQHTQRADTAHEAHLATIDTWQAGQGEQITSGLDATATTVRGQTDAAAEQVRTQTTAAHDAATAHVDQRRQDIRALNSGGDAATPRGKGHAEVGSHVTKQAESGLADQSADALGQLRSGGTQAAGTLAEHGADITSQVTGQAPALHAQVDDTAAGARSAAADTRAQTLTALDAAHGRSLASIADVQAKGQAALTAERDRAHTDLVENAGRARQSVRDAVGGALTAAGTQLRAALAPVAGRRVGTAKAARIRSELTAAMDEGGTGLRQQVTDSTTGIADALTAGGNDAAAKFGDVHQQTDTMLGTVQEHHSGVGADVLAQVDGHQQQAAQTLTSQGGAAVRQSLDGIAQAGHQAADQLDTQAGQIAGHIDTQATQTRGAADQAVSSASGRIADGRNKVDAKVPAKESGGVLSAIGDWFKQQWNDLVDMIKDPGFWVGLVVAIVITVVLAPVLGPFALVVAGAAAGAAAQMTHNVIAGKPLFDGVLKAAALGALGGAVFALATVVIALAGLEGLAALAVLEVATVIVTVVVNAITGQRLTKGLLANMLLVGILHTIMKYFSGPVVEDPIVDDPSVDPLPDKEQPAPDKDQPTPDQDQPNKDQPGPEGDKYVACFLPGTPVLMVGGLRPIETVRPGDRVYSRPAAGVGATVPSRVSDAFAGSALRARRIRVAGGDLLVTRAHQFRLGSGHWKRSRDLVAGDELETFDGTPARVESVADLTWPAAVATHNLTVPDLATYFVGVGRVAVLVHNANPPKELPNFERPLLWIFGGKAQVRDTDTDGKSMWRTNSKAEVDKLFEARVNVDGRSESDAHIFYDEADVAGAGIQLPPTPGQGGAAQAGLTHLSARPADADPNPAVDLTPAQQSELQAKFDALPKPTKVTPKMLKGTCG